MFDQTALIADALSLKAEFDKLLGNARVRNARHHKIAGYLCLTIAEQFSATLYLVQGGYSSHAPLIVRSMLEALADMLCIVTDPNFVDQLIFDSARDDIRMFAEFSEDPEMQKNQEAMGILSTWSRKADDRLKAMKIRKIKKLSTEQRFAKAGIKPLYVAFRMYSAFAHNQLSALMGRHGEVEPSTEIRYGMPVPPDFMKGMLMLSARLFITAVSQASHFTTIPTDELSRYIARSETRWRTEN